MRKLVIIFLFITAFTNLKGQNSAYKSTTWSEGWKVAFSEEGQKYWLPEFTLRYSAGIYSGGPQLTGGIRIDDKRTIGIMLGHGELYIDAVPGSIYHIESALFMRRYFHIGTRSIVTLYSDFSVGASWVYKLTGTDYTNPIKEYSVIDDYNPGDVWFYAAIEPGVKFRLYRNMHLFLGPTVATDRLGLHIGVGF